MTERRIVLPPGSLEHAVVELAPELSRYACDVLRLPKGAEISLTDGEGGSALGSLEIAKSRVRVHVEAGSIERHERTERIAITLIQGLAKGDKIDAVVRQATELGVHRIVVVTTSRTLGLGAARVERWRAIADDAVRVSGRWHRPEIEGPIALDDGLAIAPCDASLCLDPAALESLPRACSRIGSTARSIALLIGPEGGLSSEEIARAKSIGFVATHIGPHVLRTETAGPAVIAMLRAAMDDFGALGRAC